MNDKLNLTLEMKDAYKRGVAIMNLDAKERIAHLFGQVEALKEKITVVDSDGASVMIEALRLQHDINYHMSDVDGTFTARLSDEAIERLNDLEQSIIDLGDENTRLRERLQDERQERTITNADSEEEHGSPDGRDRTTD